MAKTSTPQARQINFQAVIYGFVDVPAGISEDEVSEYVSEEAISSGVWNKSCVLVGDESDELVDELTNEIMDYVRELEGLASDSDEDDILYNRWHNIVRSYIQPR